MQGVEKWLFVINPKAGKRRGINLHALIKDGMPGTLYDIMVWEAPAKFFPIQEAILSGEYSHIVAMGGDGTVNRVAAQVLDKGLVLGILPLGSGNGLARTLGLSMQPASALKQLLQKKTARIDAGVVNGRPFFCTSGVGFDAHIGGLFAQSEKRGLGSYVQIVMRELLRYRSQTYRITVDGRTQNLPAFLVTVANAGQYGNDFFIAPGASVQDGVLQVVILKPFKLLNAPGILRKMLGRQAHMSPHIITLKGSEILIEREQEGLLHFDGEPLLERNQLHYSVRRRALAVLTGPGFAADPGS